MGAMTTPFAILFRPDPAGQTLYNAIDFCSTEVARAARPAIWVSGAARVFRSAHFLAYFAEETALPNRFCFFIFALVVPWLGCSELFPSSGPGPTPVPATTTPTGCTAATSVPTAPGGYYVNGNTICTADGHAHLFHGVDRPSLEWSSTGENLSADDFALMASWKANVVRIALNQDFWIAASPLFDPNYASLLDTTIAWAEAAGMDVILDLHWSDAGVLGSCDPTKGCQQNMADSNSLTFWSQVGARYAGDGHVLFELYNEPHDVSWNIWQSGGTAGNGWHAVGMQQLYDAVRMAGADNLVVVGGLEYAYDLSQVTSHRIAGYNIVYATHPYNNSADKAPTSWDQYWGYLTQTDPVIVTEFGDLSTACSGDYSSKLISYADKHGASWTAWAWFPGGCTFPALINDWQGAPSASGTVVKAALAGYNDPSRLASDAGTTDAGGEVADGEIAATDGPAPDLAPADGGADPSDAGASDSGSDGL